MILVAGIDLTERPHWWLDIAIVLYIIAYGYSFFVQRRIVDAGHRDDVGAAAARRDRPAARAAGAGQADPAGGMMLGILLVAIVFLMVVKPTF